MRAFRVLRGHSLEVPGGRVCRENDTVLISELYPDPDELIEQGVIEEIDEVEDEPDEDEPDEDEDLLGEDEEDPEPPKKKSPPNKKSPPKKKS